MKRYRFTVGTLLVFAVVCCIIMFGFALRAMAADDVSTQVVTIDEMGSHASTTTATAGLPSMIPAVADSATAPAAAVVTSSSPAWQRILLAILNSDAFMTLIGGTFAWLVALLFTRKPAWKKYEGMIVTAIKFAEKYAIPEGTTNTGLVKARMAVKSFEVQYNEHYGVYPTDSVIKLVQAAIPIVHDQLDAKGTL